MKVILLIERGENSPFKQPGNDAQRPLLALPPCQLGPVILINFQCLLTHTHTHVSTKIFTFYRHIITLYSFKKRNNTCFNDHFNTNQENQKNGFPTAITKACLTDGTARSIMSLKISIHWVITVLLISWKGREYCGQGPSVLSPLLTAQSQNRRKEHFTSQPRVQL